MKHPHMSPATAYKRLDALAGHPLWPLLDSQFPIASVFELSLLCKIHESTLRNWFVAAEWEHPRWKIVRPTKKWQPVLLTPLWNVPSTAS